MTDKIAMFILDGVLRFDYNACEDENLRSWLENLLPEELMTGMMKLEVPVRIDHWDDDGPRIVIDP